VAAAVGLSAKAAAKWRHINGLENFRGCAERRSTAHHGGFKRNSRLSIRERSFRFNHRNDEKCLDNRQDTLIEDFTGNDFADCCSR